jgi:hypothetical protein
MCLPVPKTWSEMARKYDKEVILKVRRAGFRERLV